MSALTWEIVDKDDPRFQTCGAPSSKSKNAMHCELPPNHREYFHNGRDRMGRWRCWDVKP